LVHLVLTESKKLRLKGRFYLYETWESQAALDRHAEAPAFKHSEQTVGEFLKEPIEVKILRRVLTDAAAA
jgi:quinol monooxygenase YgiN